MSDIIYKYSLPNGELIKKSNGEEYVFGNLSDALYGVDDLIEDFAGQTINILLNSSIVEEVIYIPNAAR